MNGDVNDFLDDLGDMPGVDMDVVLGDENATAEFAEDTVGEFGTVAPEAPGGDFGFDPEIHAVDEFGNPKFNKDGSYRKKRGRKKHSSEVSNESGALAVTTVDLMINAAVVTLGPEWAPMQNAKLKINERDQLIAAFDNYYAAKEMDDLPPGVALTVALLGYSLPRLAAEPTRRKMAGGFGWVGRRAYDLKKWWRKRLGSRNDPGADNVGENDPGPGAG